MSDLINRGLSLVVSLAVLLALLAMVDTPNNPAKRLLELFQQAF